MILPVPAVLSIIQAVVKLRSQVDTIVSVHKAADPLPFLLPNVPDRKDRPHRAKMKEFFVEPDGMAFLAASGKENDFTRFKTIEEEGRNPENEMGSRSSELYSIFFKARAIRPEFVIGPPGEEISPGASADTLLAYYSVRSGRLSNNPAGVRIALAMAETLLEIAGANASYFISNPATRAVVETLVERFTSESLDDAGFDRIARKILVAAVAAATEMPGLTQEMPALKPLLGALAEVSEGTEGKNLVAEIVSASGFTRLITGYLTNIAADSSFITKDEVAQKVLAATLKGLAAKLPRIADNPGTLLGVIEAGLGEAVKHAPALLEGKIDGNPLLAVVLSTLATEVSQSAEPFFQRLSPVSLLPAIYKAALQKIAADPSLVAGSGQHAGILRELVSGVAHAIAELEPAKVFSEESLRTLAAKGIETLGNHPELLARNQPAATRTLALVFRTGAAALKDLRLTREELLALAEASLQTAAAHPAIVKVDAEFAAVLPVMSAVLLGSDLKGLLTTAAWREALLAALNAVVTHPAIWKKFREKELVQPLAAAIVGALSAGDSLLLTGPSFAATLQNLLTVAARRGQLLLDGKVSAADIGRVIAAALAGELPLDASTLPLFLERTLGLYLKSPFATGDAIKLKALIDESTEMFDTL